MKRTATLFSFASSVLAATLVIWGCGDDDNTVTPKKDSGADTSTPTPDGGGADTGTAKPPVPVIGLQVDRFGRPAVNTALNNTFEANTATADTAKDAYNADGTPTGWSGKFQSEVAKNLAILDGLDGNCGNQIFADPSKASNLERYGTLATVLADDRQWLDTSKATCTQYLAVELNATGKIPNQDCGGRKLSYDVIDTTYSALAIGAPTGVGDNIAAVETKVNGAAFPYLAAPQ
jgi:hypothetical protein